jgi:hypothetical protein
MARTSMTPQQVKSSLLAVALTGHGYAAFNTTPAKSVRGYVIPMVMSCLVASINTMLVPVI